MKCARLAWMVAAVLGWVGAMSLSAWADEGGEGGPAKPAAETPAAETPAAEAPAAEPTDSGPAKTIPEAERTRIEKQLADAREKLLELQQEELELSVKILKVESAALAKVEDAKNLKKNLQKGSTAKDVAEYRNACLACAEQWRMMEGKYAALHHSLQYVERKRDSLPDDLKASVDEVMGTILKRRRDLLEKMAAIYEKIFDDKRALNVYMTIYQMLPADQRDAETALKQKMVDLKNRIEGTATPSAKGAGGGEGGGAGGGAAPKKGGGGGG